MGIPRPCKKALYKIRIIWYVRYSTVYSAKMEEQYTPAYYSWLPPRKMISSNTIKNYPRLARSFRFWPSISVWPPSTKFMETYQIKYKNNCTFPVSDKRAVQRRFPGIRSLYHTWIGQSTLNASGIWFLWMEKYIFDMIRKGNTVWDESSADRKRRYSRI